MKFSEVPLGAIWRHSDYDTYYLKFEESHRDIHGVNRRTSYILEFYDGRLCIHNRRSTVYTTESHDCFIVKELWEHDLRPKKLVESLGKYGITDPLNAPLIEVLMDIDKLDIPEL